MPDRSKANVTAIVFVNADSGEGYISVDGNEGDRKNLTLWKNGDDLVKRVSGASMDEIDRVILELQGVRDMLRNEGERVTREIAGYASLSHAAMTAMKVIGDSLTQWKSAPKPGHPSPSRLPPESSRRRRRRRGSGRAVRFRVQ